MERSTVVEGDRAEESGARSALEHPDQQHGSPGRYDGRGRHRPDLHPARPAHLTADIGGGLVEHQFEVDPCDRDDRPVQAERGGREAVLFSGGHYRPVGIRRPGGTGQRVVEPGLEAGRVLGQQHRDREQDAEHRHHEQDVLDPEVEVQAGREDNDQDDDQRGAGQERPGRRGQPVTPGYEIRLVGQHAQRAQQRGKPVVGEERGRHPAVEDPPDRLVPVGHHPPRGPERAAHVDVVSPGAGHRHGQHREDHRRGQHDDQRENKRQLDVGAGIESRDGRDGEQRHEPNAHEHYVIDQDAPFARCADEAGRLPDIQPGLVMYCHGSLLLRTLTT